MRRALAIYLGCALLAAWAILRAWDHLHGRPIEPDPWAALPQPEAETGRRIRKMTEAIDAEMKRQETLF